jgi:hypothetical protein
LAGARPTPPGLRIFSSLKNRAHEHLILVIKASEKSSHHGPRFEPFLKERNMKDKSVSGPIYGMAFLGALVYYIHMATGFWEGVLGVLKAVFWPGVLIYKVYELLKM